jgi:hypothetical protein
MHQFCLFFLVAIVSETVEQFRKHSESVASTTTSTASTESSI